MEYMVIRAFTDKNDKHHYAVGDRYPYRGFAKKERLDELSTNNNARGVALILEKKSDKKTIKNEIKDEIKEIEPKEVEFKEPEFKEIEKTESKKSIKNDNN